MRDKRVTNKNKDQGSIKAEKSARGIFVETDEPLKSEKNTRMWKRSIGLTLVRNKPGYIGLFLSEEF